MSGSYSPVSLLTEFKVDPRVKALIPDPTQWFIGADGMAYGLQDGCWYRFLPDFGLHHFSQFGYSPYFDPLDNI